MPPMCRVVLARSAGQLCSENRGSQLRFRDGSALMRHTLLTGMQVPLECPSKLTVFRIRPKLTSGSLISSIDHLYYCSKLIFSILCIGSRQWCNTARKAVANETSIFEETSGNSRLDASFGHVIAGCGLNYRDAGRIGGQIRRVAKVGYEANGFTKTLAGWSKRATALLTASLPGQNGESRTCTIAEAEPRLQFEFQCLARCLFESYLQRSPASSSYLAIRSCPIPGPA
jgi:hypothetical protein